MQGCVGGLEPRCYRLEPLESASQLGFEIAQLGPRQLDPQLVELGVERGLELPRFPALQIQSNVHIEEDKTAQGS